jgi:hypothetical protein
LGKASVVPDREDFRTAAISNVATGIYDLRFAAVLEEFR